MRSLAKLCEPLLLFARRTIDYLKDTVIHEVPWLTSGYKTAEIPETKNNKVNLSRKLFIGEWIVTFVFCAILVLIVVCSYKYPSDEEEDIEEEQEGEQEEEQQQEEEMKEMSVNFIINNEYESTKDQNDSHRHDCGDSSSISHVESISSIDLVSRNTSPNPSNFSEITNFSTQSNPESVTTELNNRIAFVQRRTKRHVRNERDWCLRRTRSGQIYGRYPM